MVLTAATIVSFCVASPSTVLATAVNSQDSTAQDSTAQDPRVTEIEAAVNEQRWADAIEGTEALLAEYGDDPTLLLWLGNAERARGDMSTAARAYLRGLERAPDDVELMIALGQIHQFTGNLPAAREIYARVTEAAPDLAVAHRLAAAVEVDWENPVLAAQHLRRYIELEPDDLQARAIYGIQLFQSQAHDAALEQFRTVLASAPEHPGALYGLGVVLADRPAKHEEAVAVLERATRIVPEHADAHYVFGRVLLDLGRVDEALVELVRAIQLDPQHAEAHYRLALAHRQLGNVDESSRMQTQFLKLARTADADDHGYKQVKTLFNAVSAALESGDSVAVDRALDELLTAAPDDPAALVIAAKIRFSSGDARGALDAARRAVRLDPAHWEAQYLLGMLLYRAGRTAEARAALEVSLDGNPLFSDCHAMLGNVLVAQRDHNGALTAYHAALTLEPDNPNHHLNLATVYRRLGDTTKEAEHMTEYRRLVATPDQERQQ